MSSAKTRSGTAQPDKDAFSVLGQFELVTEGQQAKVGLGKFFATGLAARRLADGFASALSNDTEMVAVPAMAARDREQSRPGIE